MSLILDGTNGLSDVDGTAAAPALRGTDANTGIFFPAADTIAFAEGGAEVARFDSSGSLGIGATTINNAITTYRGAGVNNYIQFTNSTTGTASTDGCLIGVAADDTSLRLRVLEAASIIFTTSDTERARISSGGDVFIRRTSTYSYANGALCVEGTGGNPCIVAGTAGTTSYNNMVFGNGNGGVGSISTNGSSTAFNTSSDYRLKNAIAPMTGALDKVALLKPCTYKWNVDGSDGQGFIAHELQEVVEGCVTGEKDAVDADGNPQYQGIDTSFLVATLTAAIQELHALVKTQDSTITALTTRITALEAA